MITNLDTYFIETTDRYYNRLVNIYNKRMAKANDKDYTHKEFTNYCVAILDMRYAANEREEIVSDLEHNYKIGNELSLAIKALRENMHNRINIDSIDFIEVTSDKEEPEFEVVSTSKKPETFFIDQYSDMELVRMFSEFKAYQKFNEFLKTANSITETTATLDKVEKSKDFTTARQVLAVHYLLKFANVKNVDKTEIARFIQFLTGKNFDNIYKKLQSPFKLNDKSLREDLRFVRDYFERLGLFEIVKMINNEISS
jgi:hypothetical protein